MLRQRRVCFLAAAVLVPIWAVAQTKPIELGFAGLLKPTNRALAPTEKLLKVNGKRVRMTGFMALMESPPLGGFWLCPSPVFQDESGAGTGELPPNAVFISVRGAGKKPVSYLAGALSVSGVFRLRPEFPRLTMTLDSAKDIVVPKRKGSRKS